MSAVLPTTPAGVVAAVVSLITARSGRIRVIVDGAPAAAPDDLASRVVAALAPRRALHVRADRFWRPASLRLERGHEDPDVWLDGWLDDDALRREVLDPFPVTGRALPELRDPVTDRSVRAAAVELPSDGVVVVSGSALLGRGLPFDVAVHVRLTRAALIRRTPRSHAWTLPALDRYETERNPQDLADLVVRADDPQHPALAFPKVAEGRAP
ncbi:MAG: uridine kinase [Actinobacteria bacterium]|nr:uridine kinase [Actinomycetota bacterium]